MHPHPAVLAWLDAQPADKICTTAITAAELLYGVDRLPAGHRKNEFLDAVEGLLRIDLAARIEPFDLRAATEYATLVTKLRDTRTTYQHPRRPDRGACRARNHASCPMSPAI